MAINIPEMVANIRGVYGTSYSTESVKDSDLIRYINAAVKRLCQEKRWGFNTYTTTLVTDGIQTEYVIPYQIETFYVRGSDEQNVSFKSLDEYYEKVPETDDVMVEGERFITQKADTFTIVYRGFPDPITSLSGTLEIPDMFQEAIESYAAKEAFRRSKDWESMRATYDEYNLSINRSSASNVNTRPRTTVRWGSNSTR